MKQQDFIKSLCIPPCTPFYRPSSRCILNLKQCAWCTAGPILAEYLLDEPHYASTTPSSPTFRLLIRTHLFTNCCLLPSPFPHSFVPHQHTFLTTTIPSQWNSRIKFACNHQNRASFPKFSAIHQYEQPPPSHSPMSANQARYSPSRGNSQKPAASQKGHSPILATSR